MTKLLDHAVDRIQRLPPDVQDEIARMVLAYTGDGDAVPLSAEDSEAISRSLAAASRGEFATDEEVRAVWAKHGV